MNTDQILRRLASDAERAMKKTGHASRQSKPHTCISIGCSSFDMAQALFGDFGTEIKRSSRQLVHEFTAGEIIEWLPIPEVVPVKFTGKCWVQKGSTPAARQFYAALESLEVKYDDLKKLLTLDFRTQLI